MTTTTSYPGLTDLPLWRLLVALDDAERKLGADSQTARVLAAEVQARLKVENAPAHSLKRKEAAGVR